MPRPILTVLVSLLAVPLVVSTAADAQPVATFATISTVSGDNVGTGDVARDAAGVTYVAGDFLGTVDLDPGDGPDAADT